MNWTSALSVLKETKTPRGYVIGQLRGEDVARAIEGLREWYPEIGVGAESCHLTHEFYARETTLAGSERDLPILPIAAKQGSDVVALITLEKNPLARTITCRLGAIAPAHRGSGLVLLGPFLLENVGRAIVKPDGDALTEKTQAVWRALFGHDGARRARGRDSREARWPTPAD